MPKPAQHQPTGACQRDHCYSHGVDEPINNRPYYLACGECYHLFRTRWNLWADHLRTAGACYWHELRAPLWREEPGPFDYAWASITTHQTPTGPWRASALLHLALLPFTRPSHINTCPHCIHDL
jgi:hypothetical protein